MRVVITGGTGFIGAALSQSLVAEGHDVVALTRNPGARPEGFPEKARLVAWDGKTSSGWAAEADKADAIVNLAGENIASGRWTAARKKRIRDSRLDAGKAVVEAVEAAAVKPKVLIQASAVGYYGDRPGEHLDEFSTNGEGFLASVAREWEACTARVESLGVRRVVVRSGIVLGRNAGALPRMAAPFRFFIGGPIGSGAQGVSWIHVSDEIGAIRHLIANEDASGPFNLSSPENVSMREFAKAIGKAMKRPSWIRVPGLTLRLLLGEMASEVLLSGQMAKPARLLESGYVFGFPGLGGALADLL